MADTFGTTTPTTFSPVSVPGNQSNMDQVLFWVWIAEIVVVAISGLVMLVADGGARSTAKVVFGLGMVVLVLHTVGPMMLSMME